MCNHSSVDEQINGVDSSGVATRSRLMDDMSFCREPILLN